MSVALSFPQANIFQEFEDLVVKQKSIKEAPSNLILVARELAIIATLCKELNKLATIKEERPTSIGSKILPILVLEIANKIQRAETLSTDEYRLYSLYSASHNNSIELPSWYKSNSKDIDLLTSKTSYPDVLEFLSNPELKLKLNTTITNLAKVREKILKAKSKHIQDLDEIAPLEFEEAGYISILDDELLKKDEKNEDLIHKNIFPEKILGILSGISVTATPNHFQINKLLKVHSKLSEIIIELSQQDTITTQSFFSDNNELKTVEATYSKQDLPELISSFLEIKQAIVDTYIILKNNETDQIKRYSHEFNQLKKASSSLFNIEEKSHIDLRIQSSIQERSSRSRDTQDIICDLLSKTSQESIIELINFKIIHLPYSQLKTIIEDGYYSKLVRITVENILLGQNDIFNKIKNTYKDTDFKFIVEFGEKIRKYIKENNHSSLVSFINTALSNTNQHTNPKDLIVIIFTLEHLLNSDFRENFIQGFSEKDKLQSSIEHYIKSNQSFGKEAIEFIETTRKNIYKKLYTTLSDYLGNNAVVKKLLNKMDKFLKLVRASQKNPNITSKNIFNSMLLYGTPGVGKTFLIKCLATELGLPIIEITREEMSTILNEGKANTKSAEGLFNNFISQKISEASEAMKKNGAISSIILFDEMESDFYNREKGNRDDSAETNIMLRVIEKQITKHFSMMFIGITNHFNDVDLAAKRAGRFGMHIEITNPDREGVIEIIESIFKKFKLKINTSTDKDATMEMLISELIGLIPINIIGSIEQSIILQMEEGNAVKLDRILNDIKEHKTWLQSSI